LNGQKLKFGAGPEVCYAVHLFVLPAVQHPFNLQCDNYHTLQIKGHKTHQHFMTVTKQMLSYLDHGLSSGMFLEKGVIVSVYGKRQSDIAIYDSLEGDRLYRNNIQELIEELQLDHTSEQWIYLRSI
jgi:hypothetical protein